MKNAKAYIREDAPGKQTVTSLAYWLTPEGLTNAVVATLVRKAIEKASEDEFREAFDGATKDDARKILAVHELCAMPYWGKDELAKAIHDADPGRDELMAARAVALAQSVEELPDAFTPRQGIEWAMDRGYLFGIHAHFSGARPGEYGHPHNSLHDGPHHRGRSVAPQTVTDAAPPAIEAPPETKRAKRPGRPRVDNKRKLAQRILDAMREAAGLAPDADAPWPIAEIHATAETIERTHCGSVRVFSVSTPTLDGWLEGTKRRKGGRTNFPKKLMPQVTGKFTKDDFPRN